MRACLILGLLASPLQVQLQVDQDPNFQRLENGLELLFDPIPAAEAMGLFCFVKTGYRQDPVGKSGLAHLLEHLLFTSKGQGRVSGWSQERWKDERKHGAAAKTSADWTLYYSIGTREELSDDALWLHDVLSGEAVFTAEDLDRERVRSGKEVSAETTFFPRSTLEWRARVLLNRGTAMGRFGIGDLDEMGELTLEELKARYLQTHRVDNVLLVLVGAVDKKKDLPFYREVFGGIAVPKGAQAVKAPKFVKTAVAIQAFTEHPNVAAVFGSYVFKAAQPREPGYAKGLLAGLWLVHEAQLAFGPELTKKEGISRFYPGIHDLLENPDLLLLNRRGGGGQGREDLRRVLEELIGKTGKKTLDHELLIVLKRKLRAVYDPLPRTTRREEMLGRHPNLLMNLGLARGVFRLSGLGGSFWEDVSRVTAKDVEEELRRRFTKEKGVFVGLLPKKEK